MITRKQNYSMQDVKDGLQLLLKLSTDSSIVKSHAINIISGNNDSILAIYNWVKQNVSYVPDIDGAKQFSNDTTNVTELFISPVKQIEYYNEGKAIFGDCDDHALLTTALYRSLGIRSNIVIIDTVNMGFDHAYSQVWSDRLHQYVSADTTAKYPFGWVIPSYQTIFIY